MPNQHFQCETCGEILLITYRAVEVDTPGWPSYGHGDCGGRLVQAPQPCDFGFDLKSDGEGGKGFQKFTVHRQVPTRAGLVQVEETIDSLHKVRQLEKDSEQRYRDGEGEPLRFRAYQQSSSNMDTNSFGESGTLGDRQYDSGRQPQPKPNIGVKRHGQQQPVIPLGLGLRRGATPLKG